jgi:hypothetical protein
VPSLAGQEDGSSDAHFKAAADPWLRLLEEFPAVVCPLPPSTVSKITLSQRGGHEPPSSGSWTQSGQERVFVHAGSRENSAVIQRLGVPSPHSVKKDSSWRPCGDLRQLKGTVQRKLTGVLSGINRKLMPCHCSDGHSFFNLKGLHSLKSKNVISALTGTFL